METMKLWRWIKEKTTYLFVQMGLEVLQLVWHKIRMKIREKQQMIWRPKLERCADRSWKRRSKGNGKLELLGGQQGEYGVGSKQEMLIMYIS